MVHTDDDCRKQEIECEMGKESSENEYPRYSVLMSVYQKEDAEFLCEALDSMMQQTICPDEIVLVEDGPLTEELYDAITGFVKSHPNLFNIVQLDENRGLGYALAAGLPQCRNEIVARMDSDDYSFPTRMEKQLQALVSGNLDMVGSQIIEFIVDPAHPVTVSDLPESAADIQIFSKKRNPFRHPSMVFRKSKALQAGNYSGEFLYFEDWDLFNRMLSEGCSALNLHETLVAMRVNKDFYARRGGFKYLPHIWKFKREQLRNGYFTFGQFLSSAVPHIIVCLVPNRIRSFVYTRLLRRRGPNND